MRAKGAGRTGQAPHREKACGVLWPGIILAWAAGGLGRPGLLGLMPCCLGLDSGRQGLAVVSHARRSEEVGGYIFISRNIQSYMELHSNISYVGIIDSMRGTFVVDV